MMMAMMLHDDKDGDHYYEGDDIGDVNDKAAAAVG